MQRSHALLGAFLAVAFAALAGCGQAANNEPFTPQVGQAGKDVIWVPTPDALVAGMLKMAEVGPQDVVVDLGSGDGKIAIAAARDFGATARGVEYNPQMVALSKENAAKAGVADKATFIEGDIFKTDFSDATVVTMYLLPRLNLELRPKLLEMRPGTRLVSHAFDMGEWRPDEQITVEGANGYLWIVPAKAAGDWRFDLGQGVRVDASLAQTFQALTAANVKRNGANGALSEVALRGDALSFVVEGSPKIAVRGRVVDGKFTGEATPAGAAARPASGALVTPAAVATP